MTRNFFSPNIGHLTPFLVDYRNLASFETQPRIFFPKTTRRITGTKVKITPMWSETAEVIAVVAVVTKSTGSIMK